MRFYESLSLPQNLFQHSTQAIRNVRTTNTTILYIIHQQPMQVNTHTINNLQLVLALEVPYLVGAGVLPSQKVVCYRLSLY